MVVRPVHDIPEPGIKKSEGKGGRIHVNFVHGKLGRVGNCGLSRASV